MGTPRLAARTEPKNRAWDQPRRTRAREGKGGQRAIIQKLTLRPAQPEDFAFCERTYFEPMRATIEEWARINETLGSVA